MILATDNLKATDILAALKITSNNLADIYYKANGTKKSYQEFLTTAKGVFDLTFSSSASSVYAKQDLRSFLGYKSENLSLSTTSYLADWGGDQLIITVSGVDSFQVHYSSVQTGMRISTLQNTIIVDWAMNLRTDQVEDYITVIGGSKTIKVTLNQEAKPSITGLPDSISLTGNLREDGSKLYTFSCNYPLSDIATNFKGSVGFTAFLVERSSKELQIYFNPKLLAGAHTYTASDVLIVSCKGVKIEINCSANLFYDDGRIEERIQT